MIKPKSALISAAAGFIFSFLISIISTHRFGRSLLRGLVFAVIIGLIVFGLTFVFEKFLNEDVSEDIQASTGVSEKKVDRGSKVDITISDEQLTNDGDGPDFSVENNRHTLTKEDVQAAKNNAEADLSKGRISSGFSSGDMNTIPAANSTGNLGTKNTGDNIAFGEDKNASSEKKEAFTPIDLSKPFDKKGDKVTAVNDAAEEMAKANRASAGSNKIENYSVSQQLDELPELGEFVPKTTSSSDSSSGFISDSDFSTAGQSESRHEASFPDGSNAKSHDSETLAKAIRTILHKDE